MTVVDAAPGRARWWHRDTPRQLVAVAPALLGFLVPVHPLLRGLVVWDVFALGYLLLTWLTFRGRAASELTAMVRFSRRRLPRDKWLAPGIYDFPQAAASIAMFASVTVLPLADQLGSRPGVVYLISILAVATAWLTLQSGYMVIYMSLYADGGGLDFPGGEPLRLHDFGYFAVSVGTTFGTTDVTVTQSRIRRHVLVHGLTAFIFNTLVVTVALTLVTSYISSR